MAVKFFVTHTGEHIYFDNPKVEQIHLEDIAHHLTKEQRYGGCLPLDVHYSVAEHSMYIANYLRSTDSRVPKAKLKTALLHDATETYLRDLPTGLKYYLSDYKDFEHQFEILIKERFNLTNEYDEEISLLDKKIVGNEVAEYMPYKLAVFKNCGSCAGKDPLDIDFIYKTVYNCPNPEYMIYSEFLAECKKVGIK